MDLRIVGPSRPSGRAASLPPGLGALLQLHGSGVLADQVTLCVPGSEAHVALCARFERARANQALAWAWMPKDVLVLGHALEDGFLVHDASSGLWLAHALGGMRAVGNDLDDLIAALMRGELIELELGMLVLAGIVGTDKSPLEGVDVAEALSLERRYDTRDDDVANMLHQALVAHAVADEAFAAFMDRGLSVVRLGQAERLAQKAGEAGADLLEIIATIRRRNVVLAKLEPMLSRRAAVRSGRELLVAQGFAGREPPSSLTLREAVRHRPFDVASILEGARAAARKALDGATMTSLTDAATACSPDDALAVTLLTLRSSNGGWAVSGPGQAPSATAPFTLAPIDRLWPVAAHLLFLPNPKGLASVVLELMRSARDARLVPVLDGFLMRADVAERFYNGAAQLAADLRCANRPFDDDDVARAASILRAAGKPPARYDAFQAEGIMALLVRTRSDASLALVSEHATRNSYAALDAARAAQKRPASVSLLRALWSQPRRHPIDLVRDAATLAVSWGDSAARAALPELERAAGRLNKKMERM